MIFNIIKYFREYLPKSKKMNFSDLKPIDLKKINLIDFPSDQYFNESFEKTQIILHHTVSGPEARGDIQTWIQDKRRIATCIIVDGYGVPNQLFSSKLWAGHTGVSSKLDQHSIGVEIDNWGGLILGDGDTYQFGKNPDGTPKLVKTINGKLYAAYGNVVEVETQFYSDGWRGYKYFQKYNESQLRTVGELLLLWRDRYQIPLTYNTDMWDVSQRALSGEPGVWTHVSYRPYPQKFDCHPQPELIQMLKTVQTL